MKLQKCLLSIFLFWIEHFTGSDNATIDEKLKMSTIELIKAEGYHGKQYKVETKDGYILQLHRIPYGKSGPSNKKRIPVFVMHGIASESTVWIDQGEKSLANKGYDVWLGNMRGNRNSAHKRYSRKDPRFWDFTWDHHAKYDLPSMWDFVMEKTGFPKIYNIGLSLGVATTLANLASSDKYKSKFYGFFALGPVSRLTYITNEQTRVLRSALSIINAAGSFLLVPYGNKPGTPSCSPNCTDSQILVNKHTTSGTSLKAAFQALQLTNSEKFHHYNYNLIGNLIKYHSFHPPVYNLSKISTPVALYSSANDDLADPVDVARLHMDLQNVIRHRVVEDELFLHSDFLKHPEVDRYVYNPIIEDMQLVQA